MDKYQKKSLVFFVVCVVLAAIIGWFASYAHTIKTLQPWYEERTKLIYIMDSYGNINIYE